LALTFELCLSLALWHLGEEATGLAGRVYDLPITDG